MRRAEQTGARHAGIVERALAILQFPANHAAMAENQVGVGVRVVADGVAGGGDGARDLGALLDKAADHEKRRVNIMARQHVEQVKGVRIVGAVVEGQGQPAGRAALSDEGAAVELRPRGHGVVAGGDGRRRAGEEGTRSCRRDCKSVRQFVSGSVCQVVAVRGP